MYFIAFLLSAILFLLKVIGTISVGYLTVFAPVLVAVAVHVTLIIAALAIAAFVVTRKGVR